MSVDGKMLCLFLLHWFLVVSEGEVGLILDQPAAGFGESILLEQLTERKRRQTYLSINISNGDQLSLLRDEREQN